LQQLVPGIDAAPGGSGPAVLTGFPAEVLQVVLAVGGVLEEQLGEADRGRAVTPRDLPDE
jgi:hypothetical protein